MEYALNKEELAYGQQKNREYIWEQVQQEAEERFGKRIYETRLEDSIAEMWAHDRYIILCKLSNITPW